METIDYKKTLLMPQTDLEMRGNLTTKDQLFEQFWREKKIYHQALEARKSAPTFILHDGPPYANGDLHIGHALNKILKDIVVRYKNLQGFYSPFILGWDTHGLPIENKMLQEFKMTKDDLDSVNLRVRAADYAKSQIATQIMQFKQMQLFTDFNNYYQTLDYKYEANQLQIFKKMIFDKLIYKGLKPIYWSPSSQSALAEAEVEYKTIESPQIFVKFKLENNKVSQKLNLKTTYLLIMTTTPWTLVANGGVAVGKNIDYSIFQVNNEFYIVASLLVDKIVHESNWKNWVVVSTLKGQDLVGLTYFHPLKKLICPVVLGHHVTTDEGTGLVHTAPLFGEDDYIIGKENNLVQIMHVRDNGTFNDEADDLIDLFYLKANSNIINKLRDNHCLLIDKKITHSYPHDWRTHKPIIFRATPQWFFSIKKIKSRVLNALKQVKSYPEWGIKRISNMIQNRDDWTISRQRTWGVPIIIFYDKKGNPVLEEEMFDYVINLVAKEGTNVWWTKTVNELLPAKYHKLNLTKETDIMDVWFDSGCSFLAPQLEHLKPNLYLEGNDQYRGWFNSSLINSVAYQNHAPYNVMVSHGFVLDENNQKMSKSLGNVIDPLAIIKTHGADILRLWVASVEYHSDVNVSAKIIEQVSHLYRNLRSKIRFMLGNLFDFDPVSNIVPLDGLDALINERLNNLKVKVKQNYDNYKFNHVLRDINQFIVELSSYYFEVNKDTLYVEKANSLIRRQVQTNLYHIVTFVIKALSPILVTTCEEAYQSLPSYQLKTSVFLEIDNFDANFSDVLETKWQEFFALKDLVNKVIEENKQANLIRRSNEAWLILDKKYQKFATLDLKKLLMVGKVTFGDITKVKSFDSIKCSRCWNHFEKQEITSLNICKRCQMVISNQS